MRYAFYRLDLSLLLVAILFFFSIPSVAGAATHGSLDSDVSFVADGSLAAYQNLGNGNFTSGASVIGVDIRASTTPGNAITARIEGHSIVTHATNGSFSSDIVWTVAGDTVYHFDLPIFTPDTATCYQLRFVQAGSTGQTTFFGSTADTYQASSAGCYSQYDGDDVSQGNQPAALNGHGLKDYSFLIYDDGNVAVPPLPYVSPGPTYGDLDGDVSFEAQGSLAAVQNLGNGGFAEGHTVNGTEVRIGTVPGNFVVAVVRTYDSEGTPVEQRSSPPIATLEGNVVYHFEWPAFTPSPGKCYQLLFYQKNNSTWPMAFYGHSQDAYVASTAGCAPDEASDDRATSMQDPALNDAELVDYAFRIDTDDTAVPSPRVTPPGVIAEQTLNDELRFDKGTTPLTWIGPFPYIFSIGANELTGTLRGAEIQYDGLSGPILTNPISFWLYECANQAMTNSCHSIYALDSRYNASNTYPFYLSVGDPDGKPLIIDFTIAAKDPHYPTGTTTPDRGTFFDDGYRLDPTKYYQLRMITIGGNVRSMNIYGHNFPNGFNPYFRLLETSPAAAAAPACSEECNSNVLFVPGLEGSRLYMPNPFGGGPFDDHDAQLWEPDIVNLQSDGKNLYLNPDGTSINDVYTKVGGAIDTTLAGDVYKTFFEQLANLKSAGTIRDYGIFPYDWRMNPLDVVYEGTPYEDGTHYIEDLVDQLAASSTSKKVTLVGHSNGGLVIKALMKKLEEEGKTGLIDKIIFVDVPQTGTPATIAAMLHGDDQSLGGGWVMSQATARKLGKNMPDGYALLPSNAYLNTVATPVVDLSEAPALRSASGVGNIIDTNADLERFLTTGRTAPPFLDVEAPEVLSSDLLADANSLHELLDSWTPPDGVEVIQIVGWGLDTPATLVYQEVEEADCSTFPCKTVKKLRHSVKHLEDGDGTVVIPSQNALADWPTYYLNLKRIVNDTEQNYAHANVTEVPVFQDLLASIISNSASTLSEYVTSTQPQATDSEKSLRLRVLSPVTLDVYDDQGRHTGMVPNPNPSSDLEYIEQEIPGSYYQRYGEGQYIGLPAEGEYRVVMNGTDTGTFTFEITPIAGGIEQQTVSYIDIPVTESAIATVNLSSSAPASAQLVLDTNGDGTTDTTLASSTEALNPVAYIKLIKLNIATMDMGKVTKLQLQAKFTNVQYLLARVDTWDNTDGDNDQTEIKGILKKLGVRAGNALALKKLDKIEAYIQKQVSKPIKRGPNQGDERISPIQAEAIIDMINHLRDLIKS